MLYYLVRPIARMGTYLFFRKVYFSNEDRVPHNKPVVLAINHPTGFLEPIIMAVLMRKPLYFFVRGDFFTHKVYGALMRALNMIPIFRMRDNTGFGGVKSNFAIFEESYASLKAGKIIMIFPEGRTVLEKRLRPLQKGLPRLAHGFLERYPEEEDLYIVPVGVNFTNGLQSRSEVMINFGTPLSARSFYQNGSGHATEAMLEALATALCENMVVVEDPADDVLAEQLFILDRSEREEKIFPVIVDNDANLFREKNIASRINALPIGDKELLKSKATAYFQTLKKHQLSDVAVVKNQKVGASSWLFLILGFIPALLGRIFCFPPAQLAFYIKDKKVPRLEYKLPVWASVSWLAFLAYFLIFLLIAGLSGWWVIFLAAILLGGLGYFNLLYNEYLGFWKQVQRFKKLPQTEQAALLQQRADLWPLPQ